jgi:hypothetical protein
MLCYFIYPLWIERNMPPNLDNSRIPVSAPVIKTTGELIATSSLDWHPCRSGITEVQPKPAFGIAQIT